MLNININKKLKSYKLNVNLVHDKKILGFLGESGSGKSMTLKCISGLETPDKGEISINTKYLYNSENNINIITQKRKVGYVFQNYALFPHLSILENIKISIDNKDKSIESKIDKYLRKMKLYEMKNMYPWQLSGGQQQRVALIRALITNPDILLLDEPFSALDYNLRKEMEIELLDILKTFNGKVIFVTHDIDEAYRICEDIIVFDKGIAINKRNKNDLFNKPMTIKEANITGCNNISSIEVIEDKLYLKEWGIYIDTDKVLDYGEYKYIGIRKNYINAVDELGEFTYEFKIKNIVENPFTNTIYINKNLIIELPKDKKYKINDNIYLKFNKEKLFFINE